MAPKKSQIKIYGLVKEVEFYTAKVTAEGLQQKYPDEFTAPHCTGMIEHQWLDFLEVKKQTFGGELCTYEGKTVVFLDEEFIGSSEEFLLWSVRKYDFKDFRPLALFHALAKEEYKNYLKDTKRQYVYWDMAIDREVIGTMLIELLDDILPDTCENFKQLCVGDQIEKKSHDPPLKLSYKGSIIHRVVKNGWIQGGDIVDGKGDNGWSIYGETFKDENYALKHTKRGIIGMANKGRHSNASQFYITLQAAPWMDLEYVAFGQIVEGLDVLDKLEAVDTYNERPLQECVIKECGIFHIDAFFT